MSPPAFEVLTTQKMPAPSRRAAARYGSTDSRPSHGLTVSASATRRVALEVGRRVGARGRADVAALAVGDHEQPGAARVGADLVEGGHPVGAERLEERELRLDGDRVRRDRVDDPAAEARDVAAQLDRHQVGLRIEPDDELAALALDLGGQPVGEGQRRDGHRHATR